MRADSNRDREARRGDNPAGRAMGFSTNRHWRRRQWRSVRAIFGSGRGSFVLKRHIRRMPGILFGLMVVGGGFLMAACTTWKPVVLPSGQQGFTVDCSGTNLTWSHCYQKAGKACPQGYDVSEKLDKHGGKVAVGDLYGMLGGSVVDRSMLIQCKPAGAPRNAPRTAPAGSIAPGAAQTFPAHDGAAAARPAGAPFAVAR